MDESTARMLFSKNLKQMMNEDGITQDELAIGIGVSQQALSRYTKGECLPSLFTTIKIAEELCCSLDELFEE